MKKFYFLLITFGFINCLYSQNPNAFSIDNSFNPVDYPLNNYFVGSSVIKSVVLPDQSILVLTPTKILKLLPDGLVDISFNTGSGITLANQYLYDFEVQPDGKILLLGSFSSFNGVSNNINKPIIRLNPDGSRDATFILQSTLYNLPDYKMVSQPNGKIMLVGYLGGVTYMARLLNNGNTDSTFTALTGYEYKNLINLPDGKFLVSYVLGSDSKIMRLNSDGAIDTTFTITTYSQGSPSFIFLHDNKIYIGGTFGFCNSLLCNGFIRLNLDGTIDSSYDTGRGFETTDYSTGRVYAIASLPDNKLLISGSFERFNSVLTNSNIVRLNEDGTRDFSFNFTPNNPHNEVIFPESIKSVSQFNNGKILVSGEGFLDERSPGITILHPDGSRDTNFQHYCKGFSSQVLKVLVDNNSNLYALGLFNTYNKEAKVGVIKLHEDGTINNSFNFDNANGISFNGGEYDSTNDKIVLFGSGTNKLIKVNADGLRDNTFIIRGTGFDSSIGAVMPLSDGSVIVSGNFTRYNGANCSSLIRLNSNGYMVQDYGGGSVTVILKQADGSYFFGGSNTFFNGIKKYLANNTVDNTFNVDSQVVITKVEKMKLQSDGKIVIFGSLKVNGINKIFIRLNPNGSYDSTFNLVLPDGTISYNNIFSLYFDILPDQKIVFSYSYRDASLVNRFYMARLLSNGSYDASIPRLVGITPSVKTLANGKILLLGNDTGIYPGNVNPKQHQLLRLIGEEYNFVNGGVKYDVDNNGCTISDINYSFLKLNSNDGVSIKSFFTNQIGQYKMVVKEGNYNILPIPENPSYFTTSPASVSLNFASLTNVVNQDFCATANGIHSDVEIVILPMEPARPGFNTKYNILYRNKGTNIESGTVSLVFDDNIMDFVSATPTASTQTTNAITWNFANLKPFESRTISLITNLNSPMETPTLNSGDILNYTATITSATDVSPDDNAFTFNQTVVNSFDPNDKTCLEGTTIAPSEVGKYVHYIIRFENTGSFPAQNIVVKDMIDTNKFDITSLIPLKGSHNFYTRIIDNAVEFNFENINLPFDDANNDGYVAFKIKTKPTLVNGDTFSNSANIYFDYNFPIVTNTAVTTIQALSNQDFAFESYFSLYPNPVSNILNIETKQTIEVSSISIYNQLGQLVLVVPNAQHVSDVDVSGLSSGNYFIKINSDKGTSNTKFIKL